MPLQDWMKEGRQKGFRYMLTFQRVLDDYKEWNVHYFNTYDEGEPVRKSITTNMECYDLNKPLDKQTTKSDGVVWDYPKEEASTMVLVGSDNTRACNATLADGSICGKPSTMFFKSGKRRCDWCSPPECEVCNKADAVGWTYVFVDGSRNQKRRFVCRACIPFRPVPLKKDRNPTCYIRPIKIAKPRRCLTARGEKQRRQRKNRAKLESQH